ncbi:HTH-type transcriptional regulator GlpR [Halobacterium zhouii]|uniref:HTH-type transcriptional regulator GlpR n=1 Tax=Halobacterium zhouii TaxID=2902624 RepID=UPI001E50B2C4|nr:HTH-type transcriptional regulator GlpR [Halobacterium zhouii]
MLPAERKRVIVELVSEHDGCSVDDLADDLEYSKATIRRDLRELEDDELIERSHGGAVPVTTIGKEQTYGQKEVQNLEIKRAIAGRAVEEISEGQVVFFDAGTTTMQVAKRASEDGSFLGVTNSPPLALEVGLADASVKLTGGTLRPKTQSLVGPSAERFLERMHFDQLFLGTNSVDCDAGCTTPNEEEAQMKAKMVERAERVVLVADETKLGERSFVQFANLADLDLFVTDATLTGERREAFESAGVTIADEVQP